MTTQEQTITRKAQRLAPTVRRTGTTGAGHPVYACDGDTGPHTLTMYAATEDRDEHATCSCRAGYFGNRCSHVWGLDIALAKGWVA